MRILIAEDSRTSRMMLTAVLKKAGHEVVATVDGLEAWETLKQSEAPRLVILDWMMPGMSGLEVVQRVRALRQPQPPYIIILTALEDTEEAFAGLEAGANDYLAKPFNVADLLARVSDGRRMIQVQCRLEKYVTDRETCLTGGGWKRHASSSQHDTAATKRKRWSAEEKVAIVLGMLRGDESAAAICTRYGVSATQAYRWLDRFLEGGRLALGQTRAQRGTPIPASRQPLQPKSTEPPPTLASAVTKELY